MDARLSVLLNWIRTTFQPARGLLVPVSGGSDSALLWWLVCQVFREKALAVYVGTDLRCKQWFEQQGALRCIEPAAGFENGEAARWAQFISISLNERRWLLGSRTRTEQVFGSFSQASQIAPYLPLAGVWKTDVMELGKLVGIPEEILDSSRKADPDCGRPQELAEIPLELIDVFLRESEKPEGSRDMSRLTAEQISYLQRVQDGNLWKRCLPVLGPAASSLL
jgi:NH3-dependent NAD+ synthetase